VPEPILSARGFTYRYPEASVPALSDVSIDLQPGSFNVLAGASGCGKSTLIRAACGLVPHFHGGTASGSLHVGGLSVRDHGPSDLAPIVGTVFQDPETQVVMGGVRAELALPLEHRGPSPATSWSGCCAG
jgi:energy-coupling factor transport system ATP-binding protein